MDDLFSNSPKSDDFEDISSHSVSDDELDDIFSSSDKQLHDIFSDFPSEKSRDVAPEDVPPAQKSSDYDFSYFTQDKNGELSPMDIDKGRQKKDGENNSMTFEDISSNGRSDGKTPEKKRKKKWIAIIASLIVVVLLIIGGVALYIYNDIINQINYVSSEDNKYVGEYDLTRGDGITNILLIGSDIRAGENSGSRSDTTILLSIDTKSKQLKLASFLRDTYIDIPDSGMNKLNAAFSRGGAQLLMDTLEYNFGVDIDNYIAIDFESFKDVIDALGGVDVEITANEARYINSHDHMTGAEIKAFPNAIEEGMNHFDGAQALWYCRIRYLDSDFNRTERQRKTLNAALTKAKKKGITDLISVAKLGASKVTTDITQAQIRAYTQQAFSLLKYEIVGMQIPADGTWSNISTYAGDSLGIDLDENKQLLNSFIYGGKYVDPAETTEATEE